MVQGKEKAFRPASPFGASVRTKAKTCVLPPYFTSASQQTPFRVQMEYPIALTGESRHSLGRRHPNGGWAAVGARLRGHFQPVQVPSLFSCRDSL